MEIGLLTLFAFFIIYLATEGILVARFRPAIKHVIHVNGTRGKSSVTRLIDAGLRAGGWRTFSKTTGTLPMIIDVEGNERGIHRRGRANIKEQIRILVQAAGQNAEVLVIECMAVHPELQFISQHRILKGNIGIITNVRPDHLDVMGRTLGEIGESLSNTVPQNGLFFTADKDFFPLFSNRCKKMNTKASLVLTEGDEPDFDFPENIAIALAVCEELNVDRIKALEGMKHYKRDPYALSIYRLKNDALFIGGLSINDPVSTEMVYKRVVNRHNLEDYNLILLISNRLDRGYRTLQHQELVLSLNPKSIWIMGGNSRAMAYHINKKSPDSEVKILKNAYDAPLDQLNSKDLVFAIGNIAEGGAKIMERVKKEGTPYV